MVRALLTKLGILATVEDYLGQPSLSHLESFEVFLPYLKYMCKQSKILFKRFTVAVMLDRVITDMLTC